MRVVTAHIVQRRRTGRVANDRVSRADGHRRRPARTGCGTPQRRYAPAHGRGGSRIGNGRWCSKSIPCWWRSARRTKPGRRLITRATTGLARCCALPVTGSRCGPSCGPPTRPRTASRIISKRSTARSASSPARSPQGTGAATTPAAAAQPMRLRTDAAGCSALIAQGCRDRNIEYLMTARHNTQTAAAAHT